MSRRYGRNQRRRAREALAAMTQANAMNAGLLRQVSDDKAALLDVLAAAREILGNHPALPPVELGNHPHPLGGDFDLPVPDRIGFDMMASDPGLLEPLSFRIARMHQLLARVDVDKLRGEIHCHVLLDSGHAAYAISRDALYSLKLHPQRLADMLTREIAPKLGRMLAQVVTR